MQGFVYVDGQQFLKAGTMVRPSSTIELRIPTQQYVGRAGIKLAAALDHFQIDPKDKVILDAGLSTGGFSDCMLQRGAARIYGVDVGYGLVHESLRRDPRLIVMERTNLRTLESLPELVDMVTLDLSFISVVKVLPTVQRVLKPGGILIVLIKPQFEAGKAEADKGEGVITDPAVHAAVIEQITSALRSFSFDVQGVIPSPIEGGSGNREFLTCAYFRTPTLSS